jgi:hypothetical protein
MRAPEASDVPSHAWFEIRICQDIDHPATLAELRPKFNGRFIRIADGGFGYPPPLRGRGRWFAL